MDCSPPGSSILGILQARILEWLSCFPPEDLLDPGIEPMSLASLALQVASLPLSHGGGPIEGRRYLHIPALPGAQGRMGTLSKGITER